MSFFCACPGISPQRCSAPPSGRSWQNHIPFGRSFSFQFAPQLVGSEKAHLLTPSIINWELFCRLHERIFVNFLWTVATTTKRAGTQHIKSAGDNLSLYLWWNYVPALLFRNLQGLLFPRPWQTQQQERRSRNLFRRLPVFHFRYSIVDSAMRAEYSIAYRTPVRQ